METASGMDLEGVVARVPEMAVHRGNFTAVLYVSADEKGEWC